MKKYALTLFIVLIPTLSHAGDPVKVKVQKSAIYEKPQFYSRVVSSVGYGDKMEMLDERGDWAFVELEGQSGWIHKSSLTSDKIDLGAILFGGSSSSTTQDEVTLAGKGFTPEIEHAYRQSRTGMNYAMVDLVENYQVDEQALYDFIEQGGLRIKEVR